ncbi:ATP-binding domain-containing protein, partial [Helicobacter pullorum]
YDGLYGINNLNRLLQNNNPNPSIHWGDFIYKVNDPILFNETKRFAPTLYNNLKGIIRKIEIDNKQKNERIYFEIQIDKILTEVDKKCEFELLEVGKENSLIKFYVNKHSNTDEDEEKSDTQIPFQVSYAISIHKAQGLEYDCVKIIIADEIDEQITHNIFYTAITRAKKNLTIHWSAEAQHKILKNLEEAHSHQQQDIRLLESIMNLDSKKN